VLKPNAIINHVKSRLRMTQLGSTLLPKQTKINKQPVPDKNGTLRPENSIFAAVRPKPKKIKENKIIFCEETPVKSVFITNFGENLSENLNFKTTELNNFSDFKNITNNPHGSTVFETISGANSKNLVKVHSASINPIDIDAAVGGAEDFFKAKAWSPAHVNNSSQNNRLPLILGRDFCGSLVETGGGNYCDVGNRVWGVKPVTEQGTFCEFVKISDHLFGQAPMNISVEECAAIPYAGCTLLSGFSGVIDEKNASEKSVLILGGSGGLGTLAIQILKAWNCPKVDTVCSSKNKNLLSEKTNFDEIFCYDEMNVLNEIKQNYDVVINLTPQNEDADYPYPKICEKLNENGWYITFNTTLWKNSEKFKGKMCSSGRVLAGFEMDSIKMGLEFTNYGKNAKLGLVNEFFVDQELEKLRLLVEDGKIKPMVSECFDIEDSVDVLTNFTVKKVPGKVVFRISSE